MNEDRWIDVFIICGILVLFGLKAAGVIPIPWVWVLSIIWIPFLLGIMLAILFTVLIIIEEMKGRKKK